MWCVIVETNGNSGYPQYEIIGDYQLEEDAERTAVELPCTGVGGCPVTRVWVARKMRA